MDYQKMVPIYGFLILVCFAIAAVAISFAGPLPTHHMCEANAAIPWLACQN